MFTVLGYSLHLDLLNDGPIVKGGTITFTAVIYDNEDVAKGNFKYNWRDDAIPSHKKEVVSRPSIRLYFIPT